MAKSAPPSKGKVSTVEATKSKSKSGFLDGLFPSAKNLPAKAKLDPIRSAETLVGPRTEHTGVRPEVTSPSRLQHKAKLEKIASQRESVNRRWRVALIVLAIGALFYGTHELLQPAKPVMSEPSQAALREAEQTLRDRVSFHRNLTGGKVNRERIKVEVQNQATAPALPNMAKPVRPPDMMNGLPMVAEQSHRRSSRDRLEAPNPDFADTRIMHTLQEQQAANDWEDKARQQYVEEFIANAARAGYKVKVDRNGVVTVIGRSPGSENNGAPPRTLPSMPGMAR